jgi:Outer membrane protein beta-barrel domain
MKKLLIVFVAVGVIATANAQKGSTTFGIKAGANLSSWGGDDADGLKSKIGFHAGGTVNIPVSSMFSVNPEVLFSLEGAKSEDVDDAKINLSFINIPIMLQYNNPSGFYAELGPQIGFLMSAKSEPDGTDIKEFLKSTNFSLAFGAGYKTKSGFGFGARYALGLGNIADDDDTDIKQSNLGFGVFYVFGGSKK